MGINKITSLKSKLASLNRLYYKRYFNLINIRNFLNLFLNSILIKLLIIYYLIRIYLKITLLAITYFYI